MKLKNPTGSKSITLGPHQEETIFLEDLDQGSRDFALEVRLEGEGAKCDIQGRMQVGGEDEKNWNVTQRFLGKNQTGHIELRGTAEDSSFLHMDGVAVLGRASEDANAEISERVILFDQGRGKLLPILTVKTDKVASASHGATIAPIEEEKMLYLQSRGIGKKEAKGMLKEGFLR